MTYLLLLHELRIRAIIYDIFAKDGRAQRGVDLLCIDVLDLSIQDEVIARCVQAHCHFTAEEDKGINVAILCTISIMSYVRGEIGLTFF